MLHFGSETSAVAEASESEFLESVKWRQTDTAWLQKSEQRSDLKTVGQSWKTYVIRWRSSESSSARFGSLDWCADHGHGDLPECLQLTRAIGEAKSTQSSKKAAKNDHPKADVSAAVTDWLAEIRGDVDLPELLACCEFLLFHSERLTAEVVGQVWRVALEAAMHFSAQWLSDDPSVSDPELMAPDSPTSGIADGLVPWACALLFDEIAGSAKLAKVARKDLHQQLLLGTATDGTPNAIVVRDLPGWLAVWSDALEVAQRFGKDLWKDSAEQRFSGCVQRASVLLSRNRLMVGTQHCGTHDVDHLRRAEGWVPVGKVAAPVLPGWQSDEACVACLRSNWEPDCSLITVLYDEPNLQINAVVDGVPLLHGPWTLDVRCGGREIAVDGSWYCCCWFTDDDLDYGEWLMELEDGIKVCRHILLSRTQQFAIFSDVIVDVGSKTDVIELRSALPVVDGIAGQQQRGNREIQLQGKRLAVRAFPLILPQDVGVGCAGGFHFQAESSTLELASEAAHGGTFSPMVLDWSEKRATADCEWRSLTVTHVGDVDPSAARAYRLKVGKHQLFLFRSLTKSARYRAALGYQAWNETVIANVTKTGDIVPLLMVEF